MVKRFVLILSILILFAQAAPALGAADYQEPTPEPTATPTIDQYVVLSSGNTARVIRSITYGEIAISLVGAALVLILVVWFCVWMVRQWIPQG